MARTLDEQRFQVNFEFLIRNTVDGYTSETGPKVKGGVNWKPGTNFTSGTTAHKANRALPIYSRNIDSGNNLDIDLYDLGALDIGAGAGMDPLGQPWQLAEIVGLFVHNRPTSTGNLLMGGEGTGAAWNSIFNASDTAQLGPFKPGGVAMLFNPLAPAWVVTDSTNHLLRLSASGGNVTFDLMLLGRAVA